MTYSIQNSLIFLLLTFIGFPGLYAQYHQEPIFSELEGQDLYNALVEEYKPVHVLDYSHARDTLFKNIYGVHDSLFCVYSGYGVYMDPDEDPTITVYHNGDDSGINTEHCYPRSKGADSGNAKSDMHHLFPAKSNINSERSNFPFGEIRDEETDLWFYKSFIKNSIPEQNINKYSESIPFLFEPRENFKGNVARSIFYFYTMYRERAENADPLFFDVQRKTLCIWHYEDPVDSLEYIRTYKIAQYQDGNINPFVEDCSLAARLYCADVAQLCTVTALPKVDLSLYDVRLLGNPISDNILRMRIESPQPGFWRVQVLNVTGNIVLTESLSFPTDYHRWEVNIENLPLGLYFVQFLYSEKPNGDILRLPVKKIVVE